MNLIYDAPNPPKIFIDTTVLCGALRTDGINRKPVNSLIGSYNVETIMREHRPIGDVLVELSECSHKTAKEIVSSQVMSEPLRRFDQDDFHVWITAIQEECDYILTTNHRRFPSEIGKN
jgi:hypothetical protein